MYVYSHCTGDEIVVQVLLRMLYSSSGTDYYIVLLYNGISSRDRLHTTTSTAYSCTGRERDSEREYNCTTTGSRTVLFMVLYRTIHTRHTVLVVDLVMNCTTVE